MKLVAACALYLKDHSYGEYVFDWAWANAYEQHGLALLPQGLVARAVHAGARRAPAGARCAARAGAGAGAGGTGAAEQKLSSLHLLFAADEDVAAVRRAGLMLRHTVQFHWTNVAPTLRCAYCAAPEAQPSARGECRQPFRTSTTSWPAEPGQAQEDPPGAAQGGRGRRALSAGRWARDIAPPTGTFSTAATSAPTTSTATRPTSAATSSSAWQDTMPENWLLFVAERDGQPIATSLIAVSAGADKGYRPI